MVPILEVVSIFSILALYPFFKKFSYQHLIQTVQFGSDLSGSSTTLFPTYNQVQVQLSSLHTICMRKMSQSNTKYRRKGE